jgi:ATP-binding cassette subfamily F protein uup
VLEEFLDDFSACELVVSHDRWFLDRTVDRLFCFRDGRLERFEGNYSDHLERQQAEAARRAATTTAAPPAAATATTAAKGGQAPAAATGARRRSFRENRELAAIEQDLPQWEEQRRVLEEELASGSTQAYERLETLTRELASLAERIAAAEERWLELSERPG